MSAALATDVSAPATAKRPPRVSAVWMAASRESRETCDWMGAALVAHAMTAAMRSRMTSMAVGSGKTLALLTCQEDDTDVLTLAGGRCTVTVVPTPGFDSIVIEPPCSSAIQRAMERPRPTPSD